MSTVWIVIWYIVLYGVPYGSEPRPWGASGQ